jgi:small subunit ribosomal protein S21
MVAVFVKEHESLDRAISRFKRKCERAGVLRDFKKTTYFIKPSQKKRIRREKAIRRLNRMSQRRA